VFVRERKCINLAENIGHNSTKYSNPGEQVPGILFTPAVLNNACKNFDLEDDIFGTITLCCIYEIHVHISGIYFKSIVFSAFVSQLCAYEFFT
jgi:hypothetical protein